MDDKDLRDRLAGLFAGLGSIEFKQAILPKTVDPLDQVEQADDDIESHIADLDAQYPYINSSPNTLETEFSAPGIPENDPQDDVQLSWADISSPDLNDISDTFAVNETIQSDIQTSTTMSDISQMDIWHQSSLNANDAASQSVITPGIPLSKARRKQPTPIRKKPIIVGLLVSLPVILLAVYLLTIYSEPPLDTTTDNTAAVAVPIATATPPASPTATATEIVQTTQIAVVVSTVIPTPVPDGQTLILKPAINDLGWVSSDLDLSSVDDEINNQFGDSYLYAGILNDQIFHTGIQFDLSEIPQGTKIHGASLRLTGLRTDRLNPETPDFWWLHMLASEVDQNWQSINFQQIHDSFIWYTLDTPLKTDQLGNGEINDFLFTAEQLELLEYRLGGKLSLRIDGPVTGNDNLFAWDSGYGPASENKGPELFLNLGPTPEETPTPSYVLITSTPEPQNLATAAAHSLALTAEATSIGTATPIPPNWVTPVIITATPIPSNEATREALDGLATALAITTGTPTSFPANVLITTATPTPPYFVITSTPTPQNVLTAAAVTTRLEFEANQYGTPTPLPPNWVTPIVVTSTPTPANGATATIRAAERRAQGGPFPTPVNVQTATPTPVFVWIDPNEFAPVETIAPEKRAIPSILVGKIVFLSDRATANQSAAQPGAAASAPAQLDAYVYDPKTNQIGRLMDMWPHTVAVARDAWSADRRFQAITKDALRYTQSGAKEEIPAIYWYDSLYQAEEQLTKFGTGIAYQGTWSPTREEVVLVGTESTNDEIWIFSRDREVRRQLTHNTWEWDKHPSWSPDGEQIVFFSNRTGNNQLWVMNRDGSNQRLLMGWNPYEDSDPIWVKYAETEPSR